MLRIVAFRRAGTHLLAELLHRACVTGAPSREALHWSHSRVPEEGAYITVWRPILPLALSFHRMRERFGIASSVTFSQLLREPIDSLPMASSCDVVHDGELVVEARRISSLLTLPEWWLLDTVRFAVGAQLVVQYNALVERPLMVVAAACASLGLPLSGRSPCVMERVGWWPQQDGETVHPSVSDVCLLQDFQARLDTYRWARLPVDWRSSGSSEG